MNEIAIAWTGIGLIAGANLGILVYGYGRLMERVSNLSKSLERVEHSVNQHLHEHRTAGGE